MSTRIDVGRIHAGTDAALVTESASPHKAPDGRDSLAPEGIRILIVDDDDTVRTLMNEFMETVGYQSSTAASGHEALSLLEDHPVDVVISDIMMPEMDGLQLTERIKSRFDAEIIVMTGYSGDYSYEEVINRGASDFVFKPVRFEELLLRLKRVLKERNLKHELEARRQELEQLAITDDLTRLFNARYFYHQIRAEVSRSVRYHHPLSLLIIDIDHFKDYNDTWGHLEGNHVLTRLGQVFTGCLRAMDSAYRYGGEEFAIILPDTSDDEAWKAAERIRQAVAAQRFTPAQGKPAEVTVSIGITEYRYQVPDQNRATDSPARAPCYLSRPDSPACRTASPPAEAESHGAAGSSDPDDHGAFSGELDDDTHGDHLVEAPGESIDEFIRRADTALYRSKDNGRNTSTLL